VPIALTATVTPTHAPPLLPVSVLVSVVNRNPDQVTIVYPTPELFFVEIRDAQGQAVYDSRNGHTAIPTKRIMHFHPGTNRLESFEWDTLSTLNNGKRALESPGAYTVHVEMKTADSTLVADVPLSIDAPTKIATVLKAPSPAPATISGTPGRDGNTVLLRDDSGEVALSRPLGINPRGRFLVRGLLTKTINGPTFVIDRFAPAAENTDPQGTPIPRPTAVPT
jgi:hypothetical protein